MTLVDLLGTIAAVWGVGGSLSSLLQVRRMRATGSSRDVSLLFLAVYSVGHLIWLAYGMAGGGVPLVVTSAVGAVCSAATVWVVVRLRGVPAAESVAAELHGHRDLAWLRPGRLVVAAPPRGVVTNRLLPAAPPRPAPSRRARRRLTAQLHAEGPLGEVAAVALQADELTGPQRAALVADVAAQLGVSPALRPELLGARSLDRTSFHLAVSALVLAAAGRDDVVPAEAVGDVEVLLAARDAAAGCALGRPAGFVRLPETVCDVVVGSVYPHVSAVFGGLAGDLPLPLRADAVTIADPAVMVAALTAGTCGVVSPLAAAMRAGASAALCREVLDDDWWLVAYPAEQAWLRSAGLGWRDVLIGDCAQVPSSARALETVAGQPVAGLEQAFAAGARAVFERYRELRLGEDAQDVRERVDAAGGGDTLLKRACEAFEAGVLRHCQLDEPTGGAGLAVHIRTAQSGAAAGSVGELLGGGLGEERIERVA